MKSNRSSLLAFTIVEMLVIVSILAVVASILFPVLSAARRQAKLETTRFAMRQVALGTLLYSYSNDDSLPSGLGANCYSLIHKFKRSCGNGDYEEDQVAPSFWAQVREYCKEDRLFRSDLDVMSSVLAQEQHERTWWQETDFRGHYGSSYEYPLGGFDRTILRFTHPPKLPVLVALFAHTSNGIKNDKYEKYLVIQSDLSVNSLTSIDLANRLESP